MTGSRRQTLRRALAGLAPAAAVAAALLAGGQSAAVTLAGRVTVIDGDTLEMRGERIRLFGIDAPERGQTCQTREGRAWRCGTEAARELDLLARGRTVTCEARDTDRYGRTVAVCIAGGVDLGSALVASGHAVAFRSYSKIYVQAEEAAKAAHRGLWAGEFEMPSEWRKTHKP